MAVAAREGKKAVCTENLNPNIMVMKAAEDCI
jgi:hypothetical protein